MGSRRRAFSLLELAISLAVIALLLAVLIPGLRSARAAGYRSLCADHHRMLGQVWTAYLNEHEAFPVVLDQPGWFWGGVRFSSLDDQPYLDQNRPFSRYLAHEAAGASHVHTMFCCPADSGITGRLAAVGTGERTACRSFGTSYRANANLFEPRSANEFSGVKRSDITADPARLVLLGDAVWYETLNRTGRRASWHGQPGAGNLLFMDGSVRFMSLDSRDGQHSATFEPEVAGLKP